MQICSHENFEWSSGALWRARVDQQLIQRSSIGWIWKFHLNHSGRICGGWQHSLSKGAQRAKHHTAPNNAQACDGATENARQSATLKTDRSHVGLLQTYRLRSLFSHRFKIFEPVALRTAQPLTQISWQVFDAISYPILAHSSIA
jgi:hypothetical protein